MEEIKLEPDAPKKKPPKKKKVVNLEPSTEFACDPNFQITKSDLLEPVTVEPAESEKGEEKMKEFIFLAPVGKYRRRSSLVAVDAYIGISLSTEVILPELPEGKIEIEETYTPTVSVVGVFGEGKGREEFPIEIKILEDFTIRSPLENSYVYKTFSDKSLEKLEALTSSYFKRLNRISKAKESDGETTVELTEDDVEKFKRLQERLGQRLNGQISIPKTKDEAEEGEDTKDLADEPFVEIGELETYFGPQFTEEWGRIYAIFKDYMMNLDL
jgi:hypothetical protein